MSAEQQDEMGADAEALLPKGLLDEAPAVPVRVPELSPEPQPGLNWKAPAFVPKGMMPPVQGPPPGFSPTPHGLSTSSGVPPTPNVSPISGPPPGAAPVMSAMMEGNDMGLPSPSGMMGPPRSREEAIERDAAAAAAVGPMVLSPPQGLPRPPGVKGPVVSPVSTPEGLKDMMQVPAPHGFTPPVAPNQGEMIQPFGNPVSVSQTKITLSQYEDETLGHSVVKFAVDGPETAVMAATQVPGTFINKDNKDVIYSKLKANLGKAYEDGFNYSLKSKAMLYDTKDKSLGKDEAIRRLKAVFTTLDSSDEFYVDNTRRITDFIDFLDFNVDPAQEWKNQDYTDGRNAFEVYKELVNINNGATVAMPGAVNAVKAGPDLKSEALTSLGELIGKLTNVTLRNAINKKQEADLNAVKETVTNTVLSDSAMKDIIKGLNELKKDQYWNNGVFVKKAGLGMFGKASNEPYNQTVNNELYNYIVKKRSWFGGKTKRTKGGKKYVKHTKKSVGGKRRTKRSHK